MIDIDNISLKYFNFFEEMIIGEEVLTLKYEDNILYVPIFLILGYLGIVTLS